MSGFAFDANIVIDALGGYPPARTEIERAVTLTSRPWISRMAWIEVLSKGDERTVRDASAFLAHFGLDEIDEEISSRAAALRRERPRLKSPDAIILATAGLVRLKLAERIRQRLDTRTSLPAGGQGAVGIECRIADKDVIELLRPLHHQETADRVTAERAVNTHLHGGCQVPIACFAEVEGDDLYLRALVGEADGQRILRSEMRGPRAAAEQLGIAAAEALLAQGADKILKALHDNASAAVSA